MNNGLSLSDVELLVGLVAQLSPDLYPDPHTKALIAYCKRIWPYDVRLDLYGN